jgi:hypothetical protein
MQHDHRKTVFHLLKRRKMPPSGLHARVLPRELAAVMIRVNNRGHQVDGPDGEAAPLEQLCAWIRYHVPAPRRLVKALQLAKHSIQARCSHGETPRKRQCMSQVKL